MDFQVTAQRGEFKPVECSGTEDLNTLMDGLKMSVKDSVCTTASAVEEVLTRTSEPVVVGWSSRYGWVYVGKSE